MWFNLIWFVPCHFVLYLLGCLWQTSLLCSCARDNKYNACCDWLRNWRHHGILKIPNIMRVVTGSDMTSSWNCQWERAVISRSVKKIFHKALDFCGTVCLLLFIRNVASSGGKFFHRNAQTAYKRIAAIMESLPYGVFKLDCYSICKKVITFEAQQTCGLHFNRWQRQMLFVCNQYITSSWNKVVCKIKGEFQNVLVFRFILLLFCYLVC